MTELAKSFEPAADRGPLGRRSGSSGTLYEPTLDAGKPSFSIQLPPPNVTGTLHMGHAFNHTIMDALTRYHRMRGYNTLWLPGTDHAGIATQIVVERQLQDEGQSRHDIGRKNFVAQVWEWKEHSGNTITPRCAAWATRSTGRASTSRWTPSCRRWSPTPSSGSTRKA